MNNSNRRIDSDPRLRLTRLIILKRVQNNFINRDWSLTTILAQSWSNHTLFRGVVRPVPSVQEEPVCANQNIFISKNQIFPPAFTPTFPRYTFPNQYRFPFTFTRYVFVCLSLCWEIFCSPSVSVHFPMSLGGSLVISVSFCLPECVWGFVVMYESSWWFLVRYSYFQYLVLWTYRYNEI